MLYTGETISKSIYPQTTLAAFDLFQLATVQIGEGNRAAAATLLTRAIEQIDRDGIDRDMREDLALLRQTLLTSDAIES